MGEQRHLDKRGREAAWVAAPLALSMADVETILRAYLAAAEPREEERLTDQERVALSRSISAVGWEVDHDSALEKLGLVSVREDGER